MPPPDSGSIPPNKESTAALVDVLKFELELADGNLDALDRKAALIPVAMVAIVGLFIAPDSTFSALQLWILTAAALTGLISVGLALWALSARGLVVGLDPDEALPWVHIGPAAMNRAIAGSLGKALRNHAYTAIWKQPRINWSMSLAVATILLVASARLAGGLQVGDDNQTPPPEPSGEQSPATPQPTPQPSDAATPDSGAPTDFGELWTSKGGHLPGDVEQRIDRIDKSEG